MVKETEGYWEVEGVKLYTKTWTPTGLIKASIIHVHGFSEHINRYNSFFDLLTSHGIQVFSWDQRGWGKSALDRREWGATGKTIRVIADIASFIQHNQPSDIPLFIMGHSMGGGEVLTLAGDENYKELVSGIRGWILNAPFIGFTPGQEPSVLKVAVGRLAGRFLPRRQLTQAVPPEVLSRDPEVVESVRNDPMCHNTGTLEGLASMLDRTAILAGGSHKLGAHVRGLLLAHGTADAVCSYDASIKWYNEQDQVADKTVKSYEGAYHQLHTDLCKEEFANDLVKWVLERSNTLVEAKL